MGIVPTAGQGHVGREPLPAGPRGAYGLPPQQVARPRGGRPRLARGVRCLKVDQERGPHVEEHSHRAPTAHSSLRSAITPTPRQQGVDEETRAHRSA